MNLGWPVRSAMVAPATLVNSSTRKPLPPTAQVAKLARVLASTALPVAEASFTPLIVIV